MYWIKVPEPELAVFIILIMEARADENYSMRLWFPKNIGSSEAHGESPQPYQIICLPKKGRGKSTEDGKKSELRLKEIGGEEKV
jgi:hypothetical protein